MARTGRRQEALIYNTLQQLLHEELSIKPESETNALVETIRDGNLVDRITTFPDGVWLIELAPVLTQHEFHKRPHYL